MVNAPPHNLEFSVHIIRWGHHTGLRFGPSDAVKVKVIEIRRNLASLTWCPDLSSHIAEFTVFMK
jgi:hypothetical protein